MILLRMATARQVVESKANLVRRRRWLSYFSLGVWRTQCSGVAGSRFWSSAV